MTSIALTILYQVHKEQSVPVPVLSATYRKDNIMSMQCSRRELYNRSWTDSVTSTADSFKSWDTCMDNKVCKIVAIVGIVLASIFALYIIGAILHCFQSGVTNIYEFFCWCCLCNRKRNDQQPLQTCPQNTPMVVYQPIRNPEPEYSRHPNAYYDERFSPSKSDISEIEQSYDLEAQRGLVSSGKTASAMKRDEDRDSEIELETYHPNILSTNNYITEPPAVPSRQQYSYQHEPESSQFVNTRESTQNYFDQDTGYRSGVQMNSGYSNQNYNQYYSNTPYPNDDYANGYSRHGGY